MKEMHHTLLDYSMFYALWPEIMVEIRNTLIIQDMK